MLQDWQTISQSSVASFWPKMGGIGFSDPYAFQDRLNKAMSVGSSIDTTYTDSAGNVMTPLRLENLSGLLTLLLWGMEHLTFFKALPMGGVYNSTFQYNVQSRYGNEEASPYIREAGKPIVHNEEFTRYSDTVKCFGLEREMTIEAYLQRTGGGVYDQFAWTSQTGVLQLMEMIEEKFMLGRAELDSTGLAIDGFESQMLSKAPAANIIDMRGRYIQAKDLNKGLRIMADAFSKRKDIGIFMSNTAKENFDLPYQDSTRQRIVMSAGSDGMIVSGGNITGFTSTLGDIMFTLNTFLGRRRENLTIANYITAFDGGDASYAPNPIQAGMTVTEVLDATSQMVAGEYWYSIVSHGKYGTAAAVFQPSGVTCHTGYRLDVAWPAPATVPTGGAPLSYYLFRSTVNPSVAANYPEVQLVREVAPSPRTYSDVNQWIPGTGVAFITDMNKQNLTGAALSPLLRMPLPSMGLSVRFAIFAFLTLVIKNAQRQILLKNVGSSAT